MQFSKLRKTVDGITAVRELDIAAGCCEEVPGHVDVHRTGGDGRRIFPTVQCMNPHIEPIARMLWNTRDHFMGSATTGDAMQSKVTGLGTG